jgi:hypothetical protein
MSLLGGIASILGALALARETNGGNGNGGNGFTPSICIYNKIQDAQIVVGSGGRFMQVNGHSGNQVVIPMADAGFKELCITPAPVSPARVKESVDEAGDVLERQLNRARTLGVSDEIEGFVPLRQIKARRFKAMKLNLWIGVLP